MNPNNLNQEQMYALIQHAAKKLGTTPQQLAEMVQSGGADRLMNNLSPENASKLRSMLGDNEKAAAFLQSPKIQSLIRQILDKQS